MGLYKISAAWSFVNNSHLMSYQAISPCFPHDRTHRRRGPEKLTVAYRQTSAGSFAIQ